MGEFDRGLEKFLKKIYGVGLGGDLRNTLKIHGFGLGWERKKFSEKTRFSAMLDHVKFLELGPWRSLKSFFKFHRFQPLVESKKCCKKSTIYALGRGLKKILKKIMYLAF